jgi:hypothetical protein
VNGLVLLLCAFALGSPLVDPAPSAWIYGFWLARGLGIAAAAAALFWPRFRRAAFHAVVVCMVLVPAFLQIHYRAWSGPAVMCHDSVVQTELAILKLKRGGNPYAEDYVGTPLDGWRGFHDNPAIHHFIYPPLILLVSTPVEALCRTVLPSVPAKTAAVSLGARVYDQRIVLLLFFLALVAMLWRRLRDHPEGVAVMSLAVLNPFFAPFLVEGRNDVAMIFLLAAACLAYASDRSLRGDLLLGLAIAMKTLLAPCVPFVLLARRGQRLPCAVLLLLPIALTSLPFLAADAPAFLEDVIGAPSGLGEHPFEMRGWGGFGFANVVLGLKWVGKATDPFPFWIFQLAALVPVLHYGVKSLRIDPSIENALRWSAGAIFVILYFGRFIHDNYLGALLSILVIAPLSARGTPSAAPGTPSGG